MGSKIAEEVHAKTVYEVKYYNFDFVDELETGETITGSPAVSISPTGPTLGTPSINGTEVQVKITGGTAGVSYLVTMKIATSAGESIEGSGWLEVTTN